MTHLSKGDYVLRRVNVCGLPDIWYGHVLFWGNSKNGRLLVVVEGPDFTFISDPSHLEKVNETTVSRGASIQHGPEDRPLPE